MSPIDALNSDSSAFHLRAAGAQRKLDQAASDAGRVDRSDADLKRACRQFESLLLHFMIREMRATVPESTLFPPSMAETIYTGMLDEQLAQEMADSGGIGIARMIFDQLKANPHEGDDLA